MEKGLAENPALGPLGRSAITRPAAVPTAGGRRCRMNADRRAAARRGGTDRRHRGPAAGGGRIGPLILAYGVIAGAVGAVLVARRRSRSRAGAVAALGTAVITLATLEAGAGTGAEDNEVLYLWVSLFCFCLRPSPCPPAARPDRIADAVLLIDQSPMFCRGGNPLGRHRFDAGGDRFARRGCGVRWSVSEEAAPACRRRRAHADRPRGPRRRRPRGHCRLHPGRRRAPLPGQRHRSHPRGPGGDQAHLAVTMEDMRRLLGILRPGTEGGARPRQPRRVNTLIEEVEPGPVELEISGKRPPAHRPRSGGLPDCPGGAHQCPQARGRGAKAALNLTYGPENLELEITDDGGGNGVELPSGTKKGLIGMREWSCSAERSKPAPPGRRVQVRAHCRSANASPAVGRGSDPLASSDPRPPRSRPDAARRSRGDQPYDAAIHLSADRSRPAARAGTSGVLSATSLRSSGTPASRWPSTVSESPARDGHATWSASLTVPELPSDHYGPCRQRPRWSSERQRLGVGVLVALAASLRDLNPGCDIWLASTEPRSAFTHTANHLGASALSAG